MDTALYTRVSSQRQDVDLSISAQLRALREYAAKNGYHVVREYVDEAESGRTADRPQFQRMVAEARRPTRPFESVLVWKYSRFARSREDAIVFKSLLKKHGVRVLSITEPSEDTPTGRLMEAIIESLDEFYSANLGQEIYRGMRESASRGFYVVSRAPYGYRRIRVLDGKQERAKLEPDPVTAPIIRRIFSQFLDAQGLTEVVKAFNAEGIPSATGVGWNKTVLYKILVNEAYTGTLVWGKTTQSGNHAPPVRVERAWEPLVDRETFDQVHALLQARSFKRVHPRRAASHFLLSGLAKCAVCGKALIGQDAKSGRFSYYVCGTLIRKGAGACNAPYLPKVMFESLVIDAVKTHVLTEDNLRRLVALVREEMDGNSAQFREHLDGIERELADVDRRLTRLYEALETSKLTLDDLAPRIQGLRHRQEQLQAARGEVQAHLHGRKKELVDLQTVVSYAEDLRAVLSQGSLAERKAFIRSFVREVSVAKDHAVLRYTMPLPPDGQDPERIEEVLSIVPNGGAEGIRTPDFLLAK